MPWQIGMVNRSRMGGQGQVTAARTNPPRASGLGSFAALFRQAEARWGLPTGLVEAVAKAESGFNPKAVSRAGALGLMQLMPSTARSLGVSDPLDPAQNVEGGARYLRELLDRFDGNLALALAAYNAGPGAVARFGGIPPYKETQAYVNRVLTYMQEGSEISADQGSLDSSRDSAPGSALDSVAAGSQAPADLSGQVQGAAGAGANTMDAVLAAAIRIYAENALQRAAISIGQDSETESPDQKA